jgi:hypothetical protein
MSTAQVLSPEPALASDDRDNYEIVDGEKVELPPLSADSQAVTSQFVWLLSSYGIPQGIGAGYAEMLFKLPLKKGWCPVRLARGDRVMVRNCIARW